MNGKLSEQVFTEQFHHIINEEFDWLFSGSIKGGCVGLCAENKLLPGLENQNGKTEINTQLVIENLKYCVP